MVFRLATSAVLAILSSPSRPRGVGGLGMWAWHGRVQTEAMGGNG